MEKEIRESKILIVDDNQSNIDILAGLLEMQGYSNVKSETDSRKTLALIDDFKPDLLLLDLMMPFLSGIEILNLLLQESEKYSEIKVLVLTADVTLATKQKVLALGAHDYLTKPFDLVEAGLRIKNLLVSAFLYKQLQHSNQHLEEMVQKRTEELLKSNEAIKEQNKALREIAWIQSHIVRAPVARILGLVGILNEKNLPVEVIQETIGHMAASAQELDQVIRDITEKTYTPGAFD